MGSNLLSGRFNILLITETIIELAVAIVNLIWVDFTCISYM